MTENYITAEMVKRTTAEMVKRMTAEMTKLRKMLDEEKIPWHDASNTAEEFTGVTTIELQKAFNIKRDDWCYVSDLVENLYGVNRTHFTYRGYDWSIIHGYNTYGGYNSFTHEDPGLLELMSDAVDAENPVGYLTAEDCMAYIKDDNSLLKLMSDEIDTKNLVTVTAEECMAYIKREE